MDSVSIIESFNALYDFAQRGLFTAFAEPTVPLSVGDFGTVKIRKARVISSFKNKLQWNLSRFNINRNSLFPGLDGLAQHITWMFSGQDPSEEPYAPGTE